METQNIQEAELNLNKEMTKLKLANDSLMTHRTNNKILPIDDSQRPLETEEERNRANADEYQNNTRMHTSELLGPMGNGQNLTHEILGYSDNTLNQTPDPVMNIQDANTVLLSNQDSRNRLLEKNSSTRERLENVNQSVPTSINQFTMPINQNIRTIQNGLKSKRINSTLQEESSRLEKLEETKREHHCKNYFSKLFIIYRRRPRLI